MAAGTQQTATLGDNNANGDGSNGGSNGGANGDGTNGANGADGTNGGNTADNGTGSNGDSGNSGDNQGGGNNAGGGNGGTHGFDGEFNPERARTLIDTLREESKGKDTIIKEMRERLDKLEKGGDGGSGDAGNKNGNGSDSDNAALEEIRKIRNELAEEKRLTRFQNLANGIHPDAIAMAYSAVRDEFDIDSNGVVTNMTSVIDSLRTRQPFLFAPVTQGQNQGGSAGGGTNSAGGGKLYTEDEKAAMRSFNMTPAEWEASLSGQAPPKTS